MSKIGIIGGMGPESTVDYYQRIIERYRQKVKDGSYPEMIISSLDMTFVMKLENAEHRDELIGLLSSEMNSLYHAGAVIGCIACNALHCVFEPVKAKSPIPMVSILESTRRHAESLGLKKVGLMGIQLTMQSDFYQEEFNKSNIAMVVPTSAEQEYIHEKLMTEIELGKFLDQTRQGLLKIVARMISEDSIQGLVLGCTELPLILTRDELGIPFLNTSSIHIESIVDEYLRQGELTDKK